jgi:peroxiredoxin
MNEEPEAGIAELPPEPAHQAPPGAPRPSRRSAWIAMGAVLLALTLLMFVPSLEPQDPNAPPPRADGADEDADGDGALVGKLAPMQFTLKDMNGVDVRLASFKGKVVVLNFWATWCGPCKAEIPDLVALQTQYRDDLVVLGVSVDDTPEKMKPYAERYQINYPLLVGNGREDFQNAYGPLWGIPVSVVIGRDGRVASKHSGIASREQFERTIKPLIDVASGQSDL